MQRSPCPTGWPAPSIPPTRAFGLLLAVVFLAACSSSSDSTAPDHEDPLSALADRWEATSMVLTSENDPEISVDLVQDEELSGSFVLNIQEEGRYTAALAVFGQEQVERGGVSVSGDTITFSPDGGPPSRVAWELTGDELVLNGDSDFDFNRDGEDDPATLHLELVRS